LARRLIDSAQHPNQLRVYEVCQAGTFIRSEYCQNGELFEYLLNSRGSFSELTLRIIARQLLLSYKQLHDLGYAHLDIKPENVVVDAL